MLFSGHGLAGRSLIFAKWNSTGKGAMFGNKKKLEQQLEAQGGTVAWASITEADSGWRSSGGGASVDHMKVSLHVEPDGQEPFEATISQAFAHMRPMTGWQCKVIYDPADHSRIAVLEGSITPPGIDHDRAERAAARRTEMRQAVSSGNVAEYAEELKAKAQSGELHGLVIADGKIVSGGGPATPDVADELTKLADLHDRGVLTDAEFGAQKAKLLAE